MIRAALLTPNFSLGGAERWVNQLLEHVPRSRVQWTGLGISGHGGADPRLCAKAAMLTQTHTYRLPPERRHPKAHPFEPVDIYKWHDNYGSIVRELTRDADCVLTWGVPDMAHIFHNVTLPRVNCSHTTVIEPGGPMRPITGVTHLAGCAEIALRYFDGRPGLQNLPRQVIYNGCDPEHIRPAIGRTKQRELEWSIGCRNVAVGHIGRHSSEKNYLALAKAITHLPKRYRAIYYGRDQLLYNQPAPDLLELAKNDSRIQCHLPVDRVGDILAGLDVLVIASHHEACSLAMIEAWLAGVPVVATPVGSVPELQKRFGTLVVEVPLDPTPEELALGIRRAADLDGQWIARYAREVALKHFTIRAMADNWATYLEQVCSSTAKQAG